MTHDNASRLIDRAGLDALMAALRARGHEIVGPKVRDGAIVFDTIETTRDLPAGWTDEQAGGHYRLRRRDDGALFGYVVGPHSWKKYTMPAALKLWSAERTADGFAVTPAEVAPRRLALFGARSCDLHAIDVQDRTFLRGAYVDPHYKAQRENLFVVAVNCAEPGGTCFCTSMNTGPRATLGFDLALTELIEGARHAFVVEIATEAGQAVMSEIPSAPATSTDTDAVDRIAAHAAAHMGRTMDTTDIKQLLYRNMEHPRWDDVANRCLSCANCTMVCPTCFCHTVEDVTDVTGDHAERWRKWDSCFTAEHSYIHGGSVRPSTKSRYRQWMTHKLASWIDQFGTSGCVGCGRCITWCPVAIDLTEEVRAIRATDGAKADGAAAGDATGGDATAPKGDGTR